MATTFQTAYEALMGLVNRPLSEAAVLARAKLEINNAVRIIQRRHAFTLTERIFDVTYPAEAKLIDFGSVCSGTLRDLISVQAFASDGRTPAVLKYKSYSKITQEMFNYQQQQPDTVFDLQAHVERQLSDYVRNVHRHFVFRAGDSFGLFPTPTNSIPLQVHCHIWLPTMTLAADTNFLLEFALDTVLDLACSRMSTYLRNQDLKVLSDEDFKTAMSTLISWDSQLSESNYTHLG